jgi:hypothetical protein
VIGAGVGFAYSRRQHARTGKARVGSPRSRV